MQTKPNIDALARDGIRFTASHSPCALCAPARASLFTGLVRTAQEMGFDGFGPKGCGATDGPKYDAWMTRKGLEALKLCVNFTPRANQSAPSETAAANSMGQRWGV